MPRLIGRRILEFDTVTSTNSVAAEYASDPANDGLVVTALEQTAGRGRRGRHWHSPAGGLWLSVLLFPPPPLRRPVILTALCACAVCDAIQDQTNMTAQIKWPNDVLVHGKKVCGILVEQSQATVLGIGLNINMPDEVFVDDLAHAASLRMFTRCDLDQTALRHRLLQAMDYYYGTAITGDLSLQNRWRTRFDLVGKHVAIQTRYGAQSGRLLDLRFDVVSWQVSGGAVGTCPPEDIEHITISDLS